MKAIHIRDVPEDVVDALKRRAESHRRSLQGEILEILVRAAQDAPPLEPYPPLRLHFVSRGGESTWRREEIYGDDGR